MSQRREWPIRADGFMLIEDHCEDGEWSGYAKSGDNQGNILWETEAVPIRVMKPGDVVLSREEAEKVHIGHLGLRDYLIATGRPGLIDEVLQPVNAAIAILDRAMKETQ